MPAVPVLSIFRFVKAMSDQRRCPECGSECIAEILASGEPTGRGICQDCGSEFEWPN